jgi:hypothetical protein
MTNTLSASDFALQRWNCANCGRANETVVAPVGTAQCEYCADVAKVKPFVPWVRRLTGYVSGLWFSLSGESGCIQWRPALSKVRAWSRVNLTR